MDTNAGNKSLLPQEGDPDDVDDEVFNQVCVEHGNPDAGGLFVPALPPFAEDEESVVEFVFGQFEVVGEMDAATSRHMVHSAQFF